MVPARALHHHPPPHPKQGVRCFPSIEHEQDDGFPHPMFCLLTPTLSSLKIQTTNISFSFLTLAPCNTANSRRMKLKIPRLISFHSPISDLVGHQYWVFNFPHSKSLTGWLVECRKHTVSRPATINH